MSLPPIATLLHQLVASPSVSCSHPQLDMSNLGVIHLLASWLEDLGFNVEILPVPNKPQKANLIATLGQGPGGLVFAGHTDTVPYDENKWQQDPFKLTEQDNRWYGLGATDMKGFFPVAIEAAKAFLDTPLKQPLIILATADEESSMSGARALAALGRPKARYAVIGEPTGLVPIHMHKGILMESVRIQGKSGHSSNPALGNSALETMHKALGELLAFRKQMQANNKNPGFLVDVPTLNLGHIHGGDSPNRICGHCELHFDLRALPGMDITELQQMIRARLEPLGQAFGTQVEVTPLFEPVPAFAESKDSPLVQAAERLTGYTAESVAFATEASFMQQLGMQTIVMGPGSIDQAHQPNEFIALEQINPAVAVLQNLIKQFCL